MTRLWCKLCYWIVRHWPFDTHRKWSYAAFLWLLPWAGEEAYRDDNAAAKSAANTSEP